MFIKNTNTKVEFLDFIFSLAIILLPFLYQYASPFSFLSLGDFILVLISFILVINDLIKNKIVTINKNLSIFFILIFMLNFFNLILNLKTFFSVGDNVTIILKIIMYFFVINISLNHFNFLSIKKIYYILVFAFSMYLIIQYAYHKITGGYLPIYLKYDWLFSWERRAKDLAYYYEFEYYRFRPSSLFLEPGYYALYILPALYIYLLKKNKFFKSLFLTGCLCLSTSGAGIILAFVAWGLWLLKKCIYSYDSKIFVKTIPFCLIIVISMLCILFFFKSGVYVKIFNSFRSRITRGFLVFSNYKGLNFIFGVGLNNVEAYMKYYGIHTIYDQTNLNYGATISKAVMEFGLIGFIMCFIISIYALKKMKKNYFTFCLFILAFLYCFFEDMLFNFRMGFFFSIISYFMIEYEKSQKKSEISEENMKCTSKKNN